MSSRQPPVLPSRKWSFLMEPPFFSVSASRAAASAFITSKLLLAATASSSASLRSSPRCAATRPTAAFRSRLRSSKCTTSTVDGCAAAASHQPRCHGQMLDDSTLPLRKSATKSSQPPEKPKPGMFFVWCSIDTAASLGLRQTTTTLLPAAAAAAGPPRHGAASAVAWVFHARRPLSPSGAESAQSAAQSRGGVLDRLFIAAEPLAARLTDISSQGASAIGFTSAEPPRRRSMTICCIQVVPHFG
mmetsp:Transcript_14429/g.46615  ORF Transcript_14429/g.46615 Transcript_14429/m.46615 type:complete len:245 (-) Transcript_14429:303-1037(-)